MAKKKQIRDRGTGSIFKEGDGYRVQVTAGMKADGRTQTIKRRCGSHDEAVKTLNQLLRDVDQGLIVAPARATVGVYLDTWLRTVVDPNLAPKTARLYRWIVESHIVPVLGKKSVGRVTRKDVQRLMALKANQQVQPRNKEGIQTRDKTLSVATLRNIRSVLHSAFAEVVRDGILAVNPVDDVALPKENRAASAFLDAEQAVRLFQASASSDIGPLIEFILATGCRIGEATGLRWQDVDLEKGIAHIRGQLQRKDGVLSHRPTTKTNQERRIPLSDGITRSLRGIRLVQDEPDPDGIVFLNAYGRRLDPKYVGDRLKRICVEAGVPAISPHKLRHTFATLVLAETGDLHGVQKMLGHSQVALTANLYGHATAETLRPLSDAMDRAMNRGRER